MDTENVLRTLARRLPTNLRSLAKNMYYRDRHYAHPAMKKFGTVQDLYYWVADGNLDTLLLLQNHFSFLYPMLKTEAQGIISLYDNEGQFLGEKDFSVAHFGAAKFRVSSLLKELQVPVESTYGTLEVNIGIPTEVLEHIQTQEHLYFWDRFYIGYVNSQGQTCFVHGLDKTHIYREGNSDPIIWSKKPKGLQWAPEIPVDMDDYSKFNVIMINRSARKANITLTLSDREDNWLSWKAQLYPRGVHRFELTGENTAGLIPTELRIRVKGMTTNYGRPVVFKEFANGAISAMHC